MRLFVVCFVISARFSLLFFSLFRFDNAKKNRILYIAHLILFRKFVIGYNISEENELLG